MTTYVYNPLKQGYQNVFVSEDGTVTDPGAGDTVYLVTLPTFTSNLGGTADLTAYDQPSINYTLGETAATVANVYLIGEGVGLYNVGDAGTGPTGPVSITIGAGHSLTVTGTLSGQAMLGPTAAALDAAAKASAPIVPAPVQSMLDAINAQSASLLTQIIGIHATVNLDSAPGQAATLTVGTLGPALTVAFAGGDSALVINDPGTGTVAINDQFTGFDGADTIDFRGVGDLASVTENSFTTTTGNTYIFNNFIASGVVAMNDGAGGVILDACYAEGTRLLTDAGEVAIEHLRVGDRLISARDGVARTIIWLGHRTADGRAEVPVRVRAGAFGPGVPHRDLTLSPDHAVFFEGALIPVRHLTDGDAIAEAPVDRVTYWHVELALHDLVFAEGLAAETYLDMGARAAFTVGGRLPLYAASRAWEAASCAPLMVTGETVRRARAAVAARLPVAA